MIDLNKNRCVTVTKNIQPCHRRSTDFPSPQLTTSRGVSVALSTAFSAPVLCTGCAARHPEPGPEMAPELPGGLEVGSKWAPRVLQWVFDGFRGS